ncbi:hypothetical protein DOTSEDRAFT_68372 [Dothistroma septosporum NZE10]|uniref:non-specific serine/threonine protein kinase n=1 Tax=Dothistroma septosporum (strain NZE10 / CBS 128990) TaxID=675120 RepID=N1Q2W1_DOTSN|nr:hypothetical protein DOTSEDRAFT_68372 [Dothistroma septosporum NZE10]
MVEFHVPRASASEDEHVKKPPRRNVDLALKEVENSISLPKRKGVLKSVPSTDQHHQSQGVRSSVPGTSKVPSSESPPSSGKATPAEKLNTPPASPLGKGASSADQHQVFTPPSSRSSPQPLFSPQFNEKGVRKDNQPDPFPLRGNQVDRVKKRVFDRGRGRYVLHRSVPKPNTCTKSEMRATKRLLSYPGLVRLLDYHGFGGQETGTARSNSTPRKTVWDHADLGTLQTLLDRAEYSKGLPENFVWHVLLSVLKTALYLHTGYDFDRDVQHGSALLSSGSDDNAIPGFCTGSSTTSEPTSSHIWQPVVHNSINPWNISFYSHEEADIPGTPRYPHVKLSNLSRVTLLPSQDHETTPEDFPPLPKALQTNFQAPEVAWEYDFDPQGTKSDLWSIAAVAVVMMGGIGGIANQRKVKIWDDLAQRHVEVRPCSDEALHNETSRLIKAKKWRWSAADLNQKYPGEYSIELRCLLERLLTVVPAQRPDTLEAVVWASNYYVHWLRSVSAVNNATAEIGKDMDEMEEDSDTQNRIDRNRHVGGTTPMHTASPCEKTFTGRAPLNSQIEQVELPNLDLEVQSELSSEDFDPGPSAHLLHELELKRRVRR